MPPIEDMDTAEAAAKVHYDSYEWSGCDGSRWERLPSQEQYWRVREAAEWIACIRQVNPT
jgi:hypothetical protein